MVAEAERGALASMGLGQYGSVDEMKAGLNAGLAQWARQLEAEARHRKDFGNALAVVARHCELKVMPELPAHCGGRPSAGSRHLIAQRERACVKEFHVAEILADDRTVRELCGRTADAAACIRKSSLLARGGIGVQRPPGCRVDRGVRGRRGDAGGAAQPVGGNGRLIGRSR
jgi:hypothetical protein